jgi:hypothetical protein
LEQNLARGVSNDITDKSRGDLAGRQPFRALASSYLASYAPDRPRIKEISALLMSLASGMESRGHRSTSLNLFHFVEGPNNLARLAVRRSISPTEVLTSYGLGAQSGFAKPSQVITEQMRDAGPRRRPAAVGRNVRTAQWS